MKQIFPVLCKRNDRPLLTIHRIKCFHLHSEYRNEAKEKNGVGEKNKTAMVRLRHQQRKSRVEAGSFMHCGCKLLAIFRSPIAPTKHINIKTTKSDHSFVFVTLRELQIRGL
jgi:hypothetical protein